MPAAAVPTAAPAASARRARVLAAAQRLFRRDGLRGVTMEAVAAEARVAKSTLYGYFGDREALFTAVAEDLAQTLLGVVRDGLAPPRAASPVPSRGAARARRSAAQHDPRSGLEGRVIAALAGKHGLVHALVRESPHARELLSAQDRLARAPFAEVDARMIAALAEALAGDPSLARVARAAARALFLGSHGIAEQAADARRLEREIADFVRTYLRGARAMAREASRPSRGSVPPTIPRRLP